MKRKKGVPFIYLILLFINTIAWILGTFFALSIPLDKERIITFLAVLFGGGSVVFTMFILSFTIERIDKIEEKLEKREDTEPPNDTNDGNN